jgi:hypothetical protein
MAYLNLDAVGPHPDDAQVVALMQRRTAAAGTQAPDPCCAESVSGQGAVAAVFIPVHDCPLKQQQVWCCT